MAFLVGRRPRWADSRAALAKWNRWTIEHMQPCGSRRRLDFAVRLPSIVTCKGSQMRDRERWHVMDSFGELLPNL
eukprot:scaffold279674_cov26-Tisochrysis_lutea.AAC.3